MDSTKLNNWIQSITGLAIVIGLVLVIWELQQNREAVRSQLSSDGFQMVSQAFTAVMGEDTAKVLAKACDAPRELTREEYYVLDNYCLELINRYRRIRVLSQRGSFYSEDQMEGVGALNMMLETAPGRAYLRQGHVDLRDVLDKALEDWQGRDCVDFFDSWATRVSEEIDKRPVAKGSQ